MQNVLFMLIPPEFSMDTPNIGLPVFHASVNLTAWFNAFSIPAVFELPAMVSPPGKSTANDPLTSKFFLHYIQ